MAAVADMLETVTFIRRAQRAWFARIRPYLLDANLNVGSGHGFFSEAARQAGIAMTVLPGGEWGHPL